MYDNRELTHWGIKKGGKKEGSKYVARVEENGKYRYFYTQSEYDAYLKGGKSDKPNLGDKIAKTANKVAKKASSVAKDVKKDVTKKVSDLKDKGENFVNNALKTADKAWDKAIDTASDAYNAGRNYIRDVVGFDEREEMREAHAAYTKAKRDKYNADVDDRRKFNKEIAAKKAVPEAADKLESAKREYMAAKGGLNQQKHQKAKREAEGPDFKTRLRNTFNPEAKIAEDEKNAKKLSSATRKAQDAERNYKVAQRNYENAKVNAKETRKTANKSLSARNRADREVDRKEYEADQARLRYEDTILGRVDKVKSNIKVKRRKRNN